MDFVKLEISPDQSTWYEVFAYGNGLYHFNSSIGAYPEVDNQEILLADLIGGAVRTGVGIDIDYADLNGGAGVPDIEYNYLRITAPFGDSGDGCDVDSIDVMPPD